RQMCIRDSTTVPAFAQALTEDLQSISKDKHLRVGFLPPDALESEPDVTPEQLRARELAEAQRRNFGFETVRRLEGNVGYLDLRQFYDATIGGPTAIAAMNLLGHVDAIIFDLRQNGGGDPTMIQLLTSYLFDEPTHLNSFYIRRGDLTRQFWTYASVPGPSLSGVPVWVLTSGATFSGAEEFAYNLKSYRRGTLVGEVTGGGAHPVNRHVFPAQHVAVMVPFGRAINPNTGTNWEGVGVEPDIRVPAEKALETAHLEALKLLRERATEPEARNAYDWAVTGLEARARKVDLEPVALRAYTGIYGPRRVTLEGAGLVYQREGRPRLRLIAAGDDFFLVEGIEYFRIRFERDASGRVQKLVGLYDNGQTDENPRTGDISAGS
ncbi:MAG: S41 family peptidase, partial [Candidatus Eisenbacteria bacterium]|nr:S41 family peptidase [Candidatus Eisenbacteria bacterium]